MVEKRPRPEELLDRAAREHERAREGRLKIFFGAMPGVGKTYAMLEEARARKREGVDVAIGWIETHGRRETAALIEGLERIAPRTVRYRDVDLADFDLDGVLARHPTLVLVDELAHTNAPGSRHTRRWQDVVELLEAGIDVYTTLNVQHVESLVDVVGGITGVAIRETVPDSLIDRADEIELIDLPAEDLLQRMREGKVYFPAQAEAASANFFKKGNLIALRELALRRTADRVDAQASEWKREHGIREPWRMLERIMVVIDHEPRAADLIRAGRRMAEPLRAPWIVLTVESPAFERLPEADRERLSEHLALAQRLGAETLVLRGENAAQEILTAARERGVSRIVAGKPRRPRWLALIRGSIVDELVRRAEGVDVIVTAGDAERIAPVRSSHERRPAPPREFAWAALTVAGTTLVCLATREVLTLADQAMIYLLGVLIASSRLSRVPSLLVAVMSIATLDFFFVPPYYDFAVENLRYIVTFLVMLLVAISVSRRTLLLRELADAAREREKRTSALYELSRGFSVEDEPHAIAAEAVRLVRATFACDAVVLLPTERGEIRAPEAGSSTAWTSERDLAVARWVLEHGHPAGCGTDTLPASRALFLPLIAASGPIGVFGIALGDLPEELAPSRRQVLETFVAQTALALERTLLHEQASAARIAAESERTRSTLLSAVSHDLRTPLATITGSAQVLLDQGAHLDDAARRGLIEAIRGEGERLSRLVANLLDLTRLEAGAIEARREWCPADEVVHSAVGRLEKMLIGRDIVLDLPERVLLAPMDPVLVEQALQNLIENAVKYSPSGGPIEVRARRVADEVLFEVSDRGLGIPSGEEQRIFEKFYRVSDSGSAEGAGLGLALVQAIARVHAGRVEVENRLGGGATFRIRLPIVGDEPNSAPSADAEST